MSLAEVDINETTKVATVLLNRPEALNALNVPLAKAFNTAIGTLQGRTDLRCIVIKGTGKAFMAGGDVNAFAEHIDKAEILINELIDQIKPVVDFFHTCTVPVVACVHGAVAGAGLSIVSSCDIILASRETRFLMAYDKVGAPPDCGGTYFLPQILGQRMANSLMFLGETWSADEAYHRGLVNRVIDTENFDIESRKLITHIAGGPTLAFGHFKTLCRNSLDSGLNAQMEDERSAFNLSTKTADFKNGVEAFVKKSASHFSGK